LGVTLYMFLHVSPRVVRKITTESVQVCLPVFMLIINTIKKSPTVALSSFGLYTVLLLATGILINKHWLYRTCPLPEDVGSTHVLLPNIHVLVFKQQNSGTSSIKSDAGSCSMRERSSTLIQTWIITPSQDQSIQFHAFSELNILLHSLDMRLSGHPCQSEGNGDVITIIVRSHKTNCTSMTLILKVR
jgi:hypothetical protein